MFRIHHFLFSGLTALLLFPSLCSGVSGDEIILDGDTGMKEVRLLWTAHGWPEQAIGFKVKRREKGNKTWISLSRQPICPEVSMDRNWSDQGLDAEQIKIYQAKLKAFLEAGEFKEVSRDDFYSQLQLVGMRIGDRLKFVENFDLAIVLGFGFIDSTLNAESDYEYGLFAVYEGGGESSEPLDTYVTIRLQKNDARIKTNLEAEQKGTDIKLHWKSDRALHEQLGFMSYNIYRRKTKADEWMRIRPPGISPRNKSEEALSWIYLDQKSDAFQSWYFAVAPVNKFQKEYAKSVVKYEPREWRPAEILSLQVENNTRIRVVWEMDREAEMLSQGYYLERSLADTTNFVRLQSGLIPQNIRALLDDEPPPFTELLYRVVTVDKEGAEFVSDPRKILFKDPRAPDGLQNFRLAFFQTNGTNYVRGDWDADSATNIARYWTFDNARSSRNLSRNASNKVDPTNSYTWALGNEIGGRDYTFGIQPVSEEGVAGPQMLENIYISSLKVPKLRKPAAALMDDGNILLSWEYPKIKDMIGFRVLLNGKPIIMENDIPPDARSWIISNYPDTHEHSYTLKFDVHAVFPICISQIGEPATLYLEASRPDRSIPAPDDFLAKISGTYKGQRWAYLRMGNSYVDPEIRKLIKGFVISYSSNKDKFDPANARHIKLCREYYFPIPEEYREGAVYFRCAMEGEHPSGGLFKSSKVLLDEKRWMNEISDEKYMRMIEINESHEIVQ